MHLLARSHPDPDNVDCGVFVSGSTGPLSHVSSDYACVNAALEAETTVSSAQGDTSIVSADVEAPSNSQVVMKAMAISRVKGAIVSYCTDTRVQCCTKLVKCGFVQCRFWNDKDE